MKLNRRSSRKNSRVRYLRLLNNLTVGELAYKANIDRIHLEKIETGSAPCSELHARRLAEFFGASDWRSLLSSKKSHV